MAAIVSYQTQWLKTTNIFIVLQLRSPKCVSGGSKEESLFLPFPVSGDCLYILLGRGPTSSIFKATNVRPSPSHAVISRILFSNSFFQGNFGSTQIIQDNLPILKISLLKTLFPFVTLISFCHVFTGSRGYLQGTDIFEGGRRVGREGIILTITVCS